MAVETIPVLCCSKCLCKSCLMWWSGRCPYGGCYDDRRVAEMPWDEAHPDVPPRKAWTDWKNDQKHWCRGGIFYGTEHCEHYVEYSEKDTVVRHCIGCNVTQFQDGYISCGFIENMGCEECYKRFGESNIKNNDKIPITDLIAAGSLRPKQALYDKNGSFVCRLNADGTVYDNDGTLSVRHMCGKIYGSVPEDGWEHFYVYHKGAFICIDDLR